jgi:hypothetical protein
MRRNAGLILSLAMSAIVWSVVAGAAQAQYCDDGCCEASCECADNYCGELEYCGYYQNCDDGGCCGKGCCCKRCAQHVGRKISNHAGGCCPCCQKHGWDGKRCISYQQQKDLFYNYYAQPGPFYNTPGKLYVSPLPVPANVGHTYTTYQPFMPHEYTYKHKRAYYTYNPGAGWTRTNVRYGVCGNWCQGFCSDWHYPMTANLWPLNQDFYRPGLQW